MKEKILFTENYNTKGVLMKEYNGMDELATVEVMQMEYRALQQMHGRVMALVDLIEAQNSELVYVNDILRMLGYSELACDRELARKERETATKQIEVIQA